MWCVDSMADYSLEIMNTKRNLVGIHPRGGILVYVVVSLFEEINHHLWSHLDHIYMCLIILNLKETTSYPEDSDLGNDAFGGYGSIYVPRDMTWSGNWWGMWFPIKYMVIKANDDGRLLVLKDFENKSYLYSLKRNHMLLLLLKTDVCFGCSVFFLNIDNVSINRTYQPGFGYWKLKAIS